MTPAVYERVGDSFRRRFGFLAACVGDMNVSCSNRRVSVLVDVFELRCDLCWLGTFIAFWRRVWFASGTATCQCARGGDWEVQEQKRMSFLSDGSFTLRHSVARSVTKHAVLFSC